MARENEKHIEEERLEAYAMNQAAGSELENIEEHLLFCETCQDRMQAAERYLLVMRSAAVRVRKEQNKPGLWIWPRIRAMLHAPIPVYFGAAAMAALLLMVSLPVREHPGPPVDVELQAVRGESSGTALAGHALRLRLDNQGVRYSPDWHIEIVDSEGARQWTGTGAWSDNVVTALVPKSFSPGTYYVRLLKDSPDPAREYQLVVH